MTALLSLTTEVNVVIWKGLVVVFFVFIIQFLLSLSFAVVTTLGQVSGLYQKTLGAFKPLPNYRKSIFCRPNGWDFI